MTAESVAQSVQTGREEYDRLYRAGRYAECLEIAGRVLEGECAERVRWVYRYATALHGLGSLREAYSAYLTNAHLLADCPDLYAVGNYYLNFGHVSQELGLAHYDRAGYCYEQAAGYYGRAGLPHKQAFALNNLGWLQIALGFPERAYEPLDKAGLLFNDAGEMARVADVEDTRALAFEAAGDLLSAYDCAARAFRALYPMRREERKSFETADETLTRIMGKMREA